MTNEQKEPVVESTDHLVQTHHTLQLGSETIAYTVTTGVLVLKEETRDREKETEAAQPKAHIFFVAYTRDDVSDPRSRPITFSFNGGPGSSSVWLHLGLLGPRRVRLTATGDMPQPPFELVDNAWSLLDKTDLVFIDPVSTGYSRPAQGEKAKPFHGLKRDIEIVGDFIRLYTTRYQRWLSPKFLIGESYGTTRAAGLAGYLQERHGLYLNGLMLISAILNFGTARFDPGNDLPYLLFLPTYTATAHYHNRLATQKSLPELLAEVEAFALNDYALALLQGDQLSPEKRQQIATRLASYTGLSPEYIERTDLRINIYRFVKELLRDRALTIGRLDSRFTGQDRDSAGEHFERDPSYTRLLGPYTAAFYDYVRRELQYETDLPYEVLNMGVWPWSYADYENRYVNVGETLRQAMSMNPYLKVFVANGYYDLATPYFATEYTFSHLGLPASARGNIFMKYYPAGHMMYIHEPSLQALKTDLAAFLEQATPQEDA